MTSVGQRQHRMESTGRMREESINTGAAADPAFAGAGQGDRAGFGGLGLFAWLQNAAEAWGGDFAGRGGAGWVVGNGADAGDGRGACRFLFVGVGDALVNIRGHRGDHWASSSLRVRLDRERENCSTQE